MPSEGLLIWMFNIKQRFKISLESKGVALGIVPNIREISRQTWYNLDTALVDSGGKDGVLSNVMKTIPGKLGNFEYQAKVQVSQESLGAVRY